MYQVPVIQCACGAGREYLYGVGGAYQRGRMDDGGQMTVDIAAMISASAIVQGST